MKHLVLASLAFALLTQNILAEESKPLELKNDKDKTSYLIGFDFGSNVKQQDLGLETAALVDGIRAGMAGQKPRLSDKEIQRVMVAFEQEMNKKQQEMRKKQQEAMIKMQAEAAASAKKNQAAGDAFLAANAKKEGVTTLPSGLQYKVLKQGTGATPTPQDSVKAHYRGTLIDGTEFDSTTGSDPATFPVTGVIAGWTEALQLMKVGDKWELYVPDSLAYGPQSRGGVIGPNATLIFEVELVEVMTPEPKK